MNRFKEQLINDLDRAFTDRPVLDPEKAKGPTFHDHLGVCQRCREKPFDLCYLGRQLLAVAEHPRNPRMIDVTEHQDHVKKFIVGGVK